MPSPITSSCTLTPIATRCAPRSSTRRPDLTSGRLTVIEGGQADTPVKPKRPRKARKLTPWRCRQCEPEFGQGAYLIKVRQGAMEDGELRVTGGKDIWVCATCMLRGRFTPQTS